MGYYLGSVERMHVFDTIHLDNSGKGLLRKENPIPQGVYFMYFGGEKKMDFLMGSQQKFSIHADTASMFSSVVFTDSPENTRFYALSQEQNRMLNEMRQISERFDHATPDGQQKLMVSADSLKKLRNVLLDRVARENTGLFLGKFAMAMREPDVPDFPRNSAGEVTDSGFQLRWLQVHYFDRFDLTDTALLRTPVYETRLLGYFDRYVHPAPDSVLRMVDEMLTKVQDLPSVFRFQLVTLWNHYLESKVMGHDAVWVGIAEKWFLNYAYWSDSAYLDQIREEVDKKKPNLIGKKAPAIPDLMAIPSDVLKLSAVDEQVKKDLHAGYRLTDFRNEIHAPYVVLFFWDVGCANCREWMQELYQEYQKVKSLGVVVVTVQIAISEPDKVHWMDFVNENQWYDWMSAWSPYSAEYKRLYDLEAVPELYLLDENKIIIGKQFAPNQLGFILNMAAKKVRN